MSKNSNDVTFQVTDWDYYHDSIAQGDDSLKKYNIRIYGITSDDKKIFVKVINFTPYFYVEIPKAWTKQKVQILINTVKIEVGKSKTPELVNSLKEWDLVDKHIFWEFTNYKLFTFVRLIFHSYEGFRAFERVFNRPIRNILLDANIKGIKYKLYESNIEPMLRCMHTRKLNAVGWINIKGGKYNYFTKETEISNNEISIYTDWTNLDPIEDNSIAGLTIASFDLECTSGDGSFPQPYRDEDKIIQIATTFSRYGQSECYFKHIITLGSCDPIEGVTVESYDNEVAVLLAWTKLIQRENPDIMTGYNIFGFDFKYLKERADKLGCQTSFSKLGRILNERSPYIDKTLTSSALGENRLSYYAMHGRVNIDVMKVVQRDHKLGSYKLDNVAAEFIRETILKVSFNGNTTIIETKNTYGLEVGRYIKIYFNDGLSDNSYKNEAKFKVIAITNKTITVNGILDDEAIELDKYKVIYCQAKDDVSPADIFRLQKGSSKDRAIVASYCVQDASLINKLINKLQILTNNICMANVCHVPLSYIFLRGQGIKIFSLVSKKCRERNHVIPVIRKPYVNTDPTKTNLPKNMIKQKIEEEVEEEEGYEGATVFEPIIAVHYEPITVLDYNSLYPNSMIFRNLSHECIVKNPQYDNLPGYYYDEVTYSNKDETTTTCRYAKSINGPPGILAEILIELLSARARTRKLAEIEQDPFKAKILDCLQIALKVTANSLYGQTGAPTSPIYMKDIAASTSATGRYMLNAARIFAEVIFKIIVISILENNFDTYKMQMNLLFDKKIDKLIGHDNINRLKELKEGEISPRYDYLKIFTENRDPINDKKFIDPKFGIKTKEEFIDWFYNEVQTTLSGKNIDPNVIYGDSILGNEVLMLLNDNNKIEFCRIDKLCDKWIAYDNFKNLLIDDIKTRHSKEQSTVNHKVWTDKGWAKVNRVIRHKTQKQIFRIVTPTSIIDVTEDHGLIDINGNYLTPKECIIGTELLYGFPITVIDFKMMNDLDKYNINIFTHNDKVECMKYYCVNKTLGYNIKINIIDDLFLLSRTKDIIDNPNQIVNIIQLNDVTEQDYVYDLETEHGHFHAGIGELIIKNTDSIFIKYNIKKDGETTNILDKTALEISIKLGQLTSKLLYKILPSPQNMMYEKTLHPLALLSKKRYVGNKYIHDPETIEEQLCMGIVLKRRDNAPIVKIIVGGIVRSILNENDSKKAIDFAKLTLKNILSGKYAMEKFIITKTLKGNALTRNEQRIELMKTKEQRSYSDRTRIVHAVLADRMAERDPGNKPSSNERIPYAYIITEGTPLLQGDRVENPDYILENNLPLDYLFYITNQIMKPTIQFLELIVDNPTDIFKQCIVKEMNRRTGKRPLNYYFELMKELETQSLDIDDIYTQCSYDNDSCIVKEFRHKKPTHKKTNKKISPKNTKERLSHNKTILYDNTDEGFMLDL